MSASDVIEARRLLDRGYLAYQAGEFNKAQADLHAAESMFAALGNEAGRAAALTNLGSAYAGAKSFEEAIESLEQAVEIHARLQDRGPLALATYSLANILAESGRYFRAEFAFSKAAELAAALKMADAADEAAKQASALRAMMPADCPPEQRALIDDLRASLNVNLDRAEIANSNANVTGAVKCWNAALRAAEALEDEPAIAFLSARIGGALLHLGDAQAGLGLLQGRLDLIKRMLPQGLVATTVNNIGCGLIRLGRAKEASEPLEEAFQLRTALQDVGGMAESLANLAFVHEANGCMEMASEALRSASDLYLQAGNGEASHTCMELASKADAGKKISSEAPNVNAEPKEEAIREAAERAESEGDYESAIGEWMKQLQWARLAGDHALQAKTLIAIGYSYRRTGHRSQAILAYLEALEAAREVDARILEARALNNLGAVYAETDKATALEFLNAAAQLRMHLPSRHEMGETILCLASLANGEEARVFATKALDLLDPNVAPRSWASAFDLAVEGLDEPAAEALRDHYRPITQGIGYGSLNADTSGATIDTELIFKLHDMVELDGPEIGLLIRRPDGDKDPDQRWKESLALADVHWRLDRRDEAIAHILAGIREVERIGDRIMSVPAQRAFFRESFEVFDKAVHYLTAANRLAQAVEVIERSKCRALLQALRTAASARTSHRRDLVEKAAAVERRLKLAMEQVIASGRLAIGGASPILSSAKAELARLSAELNEIQDQLNVDPDTEATALQQRLTWQEIQASCMGIEHAFLVFWVGRSLSGGFLISKSSIRFVELPDRSVMTPPLVELSETLAKLPRRRSGLGCLLSVKQFPWLVPILDALAEGNYEHITIVPHYLFNIVPFHGLNWREGYLTDRYVIDYSPNITLFRASVELKSPEYNNISITVIGDTTGDLIHSAAEVKQITDAWSGHTINEFTGSDAPTSAFLDGLQHSDITHLACHAEFVEESDWEIQLALSSRQDHLVTLREILHNAQVREGGLVILSACNSARSNLRETDELIGLSGGILMAGATAMVGSLWAVEDRSTSLMMGEFHRRLVRGESHSVALRGAQQWLRQLRHSDVAPEAAVPVNAAEPDQPFANPYYWAGFSAIGRWKRSGGGATQPTLG